MTYTDGNGMVYLVGQGIGDSGWMILRRKPGDKGSHRVISPYLPIRSSEEEVQTDLDAWAKKKGLTPEEALPPFPALVSSSSDSATGIRDDWIITLVDTRAIRPSPVNPRILRDDDPSLRELRESIRSSGLLQPITVRPVIGEGEETYEIVFGERRWRAIMSLAEEFPGWLRIPAHVREYDDQTAYELTALENLQREDLTPLEEARGIRVLFESGRSIEEVADRLGKTVGWVVRRANILKLSCKWRAALADPDHHYSRWPVTHLELISRHPNDIQDEMYAEYDRSWVKIPLINELRKELGRHMYKLSAAPWKINKPQEKLEKLPSCADCGKRSSAQQHLFDDDMIAGRNDHCLDRSCWAKKMIAFVTAREKELRAEHQNLQIVDKSEYNHRIFPDESPLRKRAIVNMFQINPVKKNTEGAFPALIIDGPGAGTVQWYVQTGGDKLNKQYDAAGNKLPKSLADRREALERRRKKRLLERVHDLIESEEETLAAAARLSTVQLFRGASLFSLSIVWEAKIARSERQSYVLASEEREGEVRTLAKTFYRRALRTLRGEIKSALTTNSLDTSATDFACALLGVDIEELRGAIVKEISDPKVWEKLNEDGTPRKKEAS